MQTHQLFRHKKNAEVPSATGPKQLLNLTSGRRRIRQPKAVNHQQAATKPTQARPWLPLNKPQLWQGTEDQALNSDDSCFRGLSPAWKVMLLSDGSVTRHLQLLTGCQVAVECLEMVNVGDSTEGLPHAASLILGPRVQRTVLLRPKQPTTTTTTTTTTNSATTTTATTTITAGPKASLAIRTGSRQAGNTAADTTAGNGNSAVSTGAAEPSQLNNVQSAGTATNGVLEPLSSSMSLPDQPWTINGAQSTVSGSGGAVKGGTVQQPAGPPLVYAVSWWNAAEVDRYLSDRSKPIWVSLSQGHVELYREVQLVHHGHSPELERMLGCPGPFWGRQYLFWHEGVPLTLIYEVFSPTLEQYLGPAVVCDADA